MRILLTLFLVTSAFLCWSQQPLIGIKNGDWIIIKGSSQKKLPAEYYDVGNFDQQGFAYFAVNGKYGIIDANGTEVVTPSFIRMESFGWGMFGGIGDDSNMLINLKSEPKVDTCKRWSPIDKHWAYYFEKGEKKLLNFPSARVVNIDSTVSVTRQSLGYVFVNYDGDEVLYDPKGNEVDLTGGYAILQNEYIRLKTSNSHTLILANNDTFELPLKTTDFKYDGNYFQYSVTDRTVRTDLFGKVLLDVPYGKLRDAGFNRFVFTDQSGKSGVMDGFGNVLIQPAYFFINPTREGYFVTSGSGVGLLDKSGRLLVPCKYESIKKQGELYIVETSANLYGVYSAKSKQEMIAPKFKKVTISDDRIRGWFGETLQIVYYNADHSIDRKITLNNTVSRFKLASDGVGGYDPRLLTIGWFFEEIPKFDDEGFNIGTSQKWGIRDAADSIIAKPRYATPKFIPSAGFSFIPMGVRKLEFMDGQARDKKVFNAIDLNTGKIMPGDFFDIDTTDALTREYLRFSSNRGFGYITQDNKIHYVFHFDRENDTYLRISTSQTGEYDKMEDDEHRESFRLSKFILNNPESPEYRSWSYRKKNYTHVVLKGAKWNFLTPQGSELFSEPFDYVDRFYKHTAIVKREGKWGVVNHDSLMIPAAYASIERMKEFNDTVFIVRQSQKGSRIMDTKANVLEHNVTSVKKAMGEYAIVQSGKKELVLNDQHEVISSEGERFRALNDRYFLTRVKRKSYIYDSQGGLLAQIDAKSRDVYFDRFILFRDGSRFGLTDEQGDTLIPMGYKSIEVFGDLILAIGSDSRVYNREGEELFVFESGKVLIDSLTNQIALCIGDKITIYEPGGSKVAKLKGIAPDVFLSGMLIDLGSRGIAMPIVEGATTPPAGIKSIESAGNSGFLLEIKDGWLVVDRNWKFHPEVGKTAFKRCKYLGEDVVYLNKPGNFFFSKSYGKFAFHGSPVKGCNSGYVLTFIKDERKYVYLTPEGENYFEQKFREATPFSNGHAAVKMRRGWTIIDANGRAKSLDSFGEIKVHGNGLFSTQSASLHGLIDHHGNVILDTLYERIEILHGDVIQAVKGGEFFYFKLDGTPIEY
ncbi:MAG: hypothetical protein DCO96_10460 [Fluviicola sp. XM-24bin1]|nr:MAG: hypothetical protein DCO96_10460 [Fluviicola sp. XM-24bin1]